MVKKFATVPRWVYFNMHKVAKEEDINKGGLFDSRTGGAINIWVSPRDKPSDWVFPITRGSLRYARSFLASILPKFVKDSVELTVVIRNYTREDHAKNLMGDERKHQLILAKEGTEAEWKWVKEKVSYLIVRAYELGEDLAYLGFVRCVVCGDIIRIRTVNDYVAHLVRRDGIRPKALVIAGEDTHIITRDGRVIYLWKEVKKDESKENL